MPVPHFQRELRRFREDIYPLHSDGLFTSFDDGAAHAWEGYKPRLRKEALGRLRTAEWKEEAVGSGAILDRTVAAIEIGGNEQERNNLVPWDGRYGPSTVAHAVLLAARARPEARRRVERWLYDAFAEGAPDHGKLFERFREIAGDGYPLIAYLFFLIDDERYAPIAPQTFDRAFARLGIPLSMSARCSWTNYAAYNGALEEVRADLRAAGFPNASHVDAHSFCWMLVRMEEAAAGGGAAGVVRHGSARSRAIVTMADHAIKAALQSGDVVVSVRKDKEVHHARLELERIIARLIDEQEGRCALTGLPLGWHGDCEDAAMLASLDRIDSGGHYGDGNLQVVCRFANQWKGSMPDGEFRRLLALVRTST